MHKLIILFCLLIASGCSNYIHTTHANIDGNMVRQNEVLEELAKDKTKLDKYLNYSKSIYPKIENLPSSDDVKNKIWSPPKIINMSSALYETNALGQEGEVLIATLVSEHGEVIISMIVESNNDNLNNSATVSVTRWKILPATLDGKPCKSVLFLPFSFKTLPDSPSEQDSKK